MNGFVEVMTHPLLVRRARFLTDFDEPFQSVSFTLSLPMLPSFKRPLSLECTQLSVTMCMSSATGTLHVLENMRRPHFDSTRENFPARIDRLIALSLDSVDRVVHGRS